MRKAILFFLTLILTLELKAQSRRNYEWVVSTLYSSIASYSANEFKFNRFIDTATANTKFYYSKGASSICDTNGRILLMSNGFNVVDSNKNFIDGLDSIGGRKFMKNRFGFSGYSQYSLFLPMANHVYYFVNNSVSDAYLTYYQNASGVDFNFDELMYTKIDMKGNGGLGVALEREVKIIQNDTLSDVQMMACRHGNGKDWWLFKQGSIKNKVYKFLFTQDSVINYGIQQFPEPLFSKWDNGGQSMFSQDGTKYASTCRGTGKIFLADFDRCTGILSNPKVFDVDTLLSHNPFDSTEIDPHTEGIAFSPNGRFLYVCQYFNIQQLDLLDTNPATQWSVVAELDTTWDAFQSYSSMYLGPDNKLYVGNWGGLSKQMSYFNFPNEKGLASGFCKRCFRFPKAGVNGPPNMPNYDLGADNCWPLSATLSPSEGGELLEVYPNPSHNIFYIKNQKGKKKELYNSVGQLIVSTKENEMDVSGLSSGVYYLKCGNFTKKIIVE